MFKHCYKLLTKTDLKLCHFSSSATFREKYDLITAVCLERKPIITPAPNKIESDYQKLLSQIEFERSLKSDHELRHEKEMEQIERLKKGEDIEVHLKQTAQDFVDACTEELAQFKFASKLTEADDKNDIKALNRKFDKHLVLVVKQKIGTDNLYLLPQSMRHDGETLRQTAERILKDTCGDELKAMIYGNAPHGFYKYKYPKTVRKNDAVGAKVFIYFARYQYGLINNENVDYKWLDRVELEKTLPSSYKDSVAQMLIDE